MPPREELAPAMHAVMLINALANRVESSLKASEPLVLHEMAENGQRVKLELAHYSVEDFKKDVPAPTPEQLQKQFDEFKNTPPGTPSERNPFGFGYLVPSQVQLAYLSVSKDEVARAVRAEKLEFQWKTAAVQVYRANLSRYATSQPATQPGAPAASRPTTGPTIRPFTALTPAELDALIREVMKQTVDHRVEEIAAAVADRMNADFDAYQKKAPSAPADIQKNEYLYRVAADIEKRFGVKLGVSEINGAKDEKALQQLTGIGSSLAGERP